MKRFASLLTLVMAPFALPATPPMDVPLVSSADQLRKEGTRTALIHTLAGEVLEEEHVRAWLGHADGNLLLEFEVLGSGEGPDADRDDLGLFEAAAVEVFLTSADDPAHGYYHFATNPAGSLFDEAVRDGGWSRDVSWDAPFSTLVLPQSTEGSWAVRMEIPLGIMRRHVPDMPPVEDIPRNLYLQIGGAAISLLGEAHVVAWAPTQTTFHNPADFGRLRLVGEVPSLSGAVTTEMIQDADELKLETAVVGAREGMEPFTVKGILRRESGDTLKETLFHHGEVAAGETMSTTIPLSKLPGGRYLMTRLYDRNGVLVDQLVQDWIQTEMAPVSALHERFVDALHLNVSSTPTDPVEGLHAVRLSDGETVWMVDDIAGREEITPDVSQWDVGAYELRWQSNGRAHNLPLGKLAPIQPMGPHDWAFWGYSPDNELLAEFTAFETMTRSERPMIGLIYGGSIDPATGALSALNTGPLKAWAEALPNAELHLMLDGAGSFDQIDDEQVEHIARMIVKELMDVDAVAGLHLDLEPYRPSQVRLTRALTRAGWLKPLSIATGLATTIPADQWPSIDFMVVMNYDLGNTPEVYAQRAEQNARAFLRQGREAQRHVLIGLPVIATHYEYTMMVEAATGNIVDGSEEATMLPFVNPALDIQLMLRADEELSTVLGPPVLWGGLARDHHVGMRRYRYFPNMISGEVWGRLLEFDAAGGGK
ncbi:MAG: hypothetical protein JJU11_09185 [Candidatus Sumerlaeia bacterium]|nr:hypothetical protein [Candidatus Sumerlaeia bacterium]